MADNEIWSLAKNFRKRLEQAQNKEMLVGTMLEEFPIQCCGIASRLLAEFLRNIGIQTLYISSEDYSAHEPHAWLVVKDERINLPGVVSLMFRIMLWIYLAHMAVVVLEVLAKRPAMMPMMLRMV